MTSVLVAPRDDPHTMDVRRGTRGTTVDPRGHVEGVRGGGEGEAEEEEEGDVAIPVVSGGRMVSL